MLDNYKDIITEIELSKIRIEGLEDEQQGIRKLLKSYMPKDVKAMVYSDMPKGCRNDISLDDLMEKIRRICNSITVEKDRISVLENTKEKMEKKLEDLQGLEYKIAYMRLQGNTLKEIAEKLRYNESYIRQVAANIKKNDN